MSLEEKNRLVVEHIDKVIKKLQENNIKVNENQRQRVINIYHNSDKSLEIITQEINNLAEEFIKEYIKMKKEIEERNKKQRQTSLNDFFDCRFTDNTLHIHVVPESIKDDIKQAGGASKFIGIVDGKLDDALEKIVGILDDSENKEITTIMVVSPLLRIPAVQEVFRKKGFDTKLTSEEKFIEMFNTDRVGEAIISRDKLIQLQRDKKENNSTELNSMLEEKPKEQTKQSTNELEKPKVYIKNNPQDNTTNKGLISLYSIIVSIVVINIIFFLIGILNILMK